MTTQYAPTSGLSRILLVDEDTNFLSLLASPLEANGFGVETASNSQDCLRLIASFSPHVLLLDLTDNAGENVSLLRALSQEYPELPVITMTAHNATDIAIESLRSGAVDYLSKSVDTPDIISRIELALDKSTLQQNLSRLGTIIEQSEWIVVTTNRKGEVVYANPHCLAFLNTTSEQIAGKKPALLDESFVGTRTAEAFQSTIEHGRTLRREFDFSTTDGEVFRLRGSISPLHRDSEESVLHFDDITQEHKLLAHIDHNNCHDRITGMYTRDMLERQVEQTMSESRHNGDPVVLAILDLRYFRLINRLYGFSAGDHLLRGFASLIRNIAGEQVTIGRTGPDEFGVLFRGNTISEVQMVLDQIANRLPDLDTGYFDIEIQLGFVAGLAAATTSTLDGADLIVRAEASCVEASAEQSSVTTVVHDSENATSANTYEDAKWVARLQQALNTQSLRLHHQPIITLNNSSESTIRMSEVLVRVRNRHGKDMPAAMFLDVAERYNLMGGIDRWVVRKVVSLMQADWDSSSRPDLCMVNLSGSTIRDQAFTHFILELLDDCDIDGSCLGFEISEVDALHDLDATLSFMEPLRERGCRFALDDFGTNLSALNTLDRLPVDFVKLDGSFVRQMLDEPASAAIIRSVQEIAKICGKRVIAECVENQRTIELLTEMGIEYAQGFGVQRPTPVPEMSAIDSEVTEIAISR